jgi:hypothetical protein
MCSDGFTGCPFFLDHNISSPQAEACRILATHRILTTRLIKSLQVVWCLRGPDAPPLNCHELIDFIEMNAPDGNKGDR